MKTSSTINAQCLKWTSNKVKGSNRFWDKKVEKKGEKKDARDNKN